MDRATEGESELTQHARAGAEPAGQIRLGVAAVNRLGFGAMRITGPGAWGEPTDIE